MRRTTCLLALLPFLLLTARRSDAGPAAAPHHVIEINLDPSTGTLTGSDRLTLPWTRTVGFRLHPDLEASASCDGRAVPISAARNKEAGSFEMTIPARCRDGAGFATVDVRMSGRIVDPVKDEPSLHFVTGGRTSGLIVEEGAFLAGGTGWYPETGDLALFDVAITVPAAWSAVSQGDAHEPETLADGRRRFRYSSKVPTDGLALSAGPYTVTSIEHAGVTISTWLWAEDQRFSAALLEAAARDLDTLVERLGPYPGSKFDIVENFFTTGYGFPSYTLLGRTVIQMGARALRPGYLDHEIAHVWLGNHVNVDVASGNWCEGLTSYVTNYRNTALQGEAAALEHRQRVSQRYSVDVPPAADFAPSAFVSKTDDIGSSIGYGKVAMVFHLLERELGDAITWQALKDFTARFGGQRATWADIRACFERASGRKLDAFFAQWIDRAGLPQLALADVQDDLGTLRGAIVQEGPPYDLPLDLRITLTDGSSSMARVAARGARTEFALPVSGRVHRVELDPEFHVPRRIAPADLPPSLARTLASSSLLIVHPNPPADPEDTKSPPAVRQRALAALAAMAAESVPGARVMAVKDVARAERQSSDILLLGTPFDIEWTADLARAFEAEGVDVLGAGSFRAGDRRWRAESASLMVSAKHPDRPDGTITAWLPNDADALESGRMIFFYGWDTWVALDGGRARARATAWPERSPSSVILASRDLPATPGGRMRATVEALTDPRFEGRASGRGSLRAAAYLATQLEAAGLEPAGARGWSDPFRFVLHDLPGRPVLKIPGAGGSSAFVPVVPATSWLPSPLPEQAAAELGLPVPPGRFPVALKIPRGLIVCGGAAFSGMDLKDAAAVVVDDGSAGAPERIGKWIAEARRRNAVALVVLRPEAEWPGEPGLVAAASQRDPARADRLTKLEETQGRRAVERAMAGERARVAGTPGTSDFPVFFGGRELADALRAAGGLSHRATSFADPQTDLRLSVAIEHVEDVNLLALAPGASGRRDEAIMLSAHFDGLGETADGTFQQGAADNAAGVAVVLEVARRLAASPATLPVVVTLFSGEEWGLQGSRALAANWGGERPRLRAVLNVDSVGHAGKPLSVVGRSRLPALAAIVDEAARAAGMEVGPDIDRHADRDGSDHWPMAARGIPALDIYQADYKIINTPADTMDLLDDATLARVADAVEASVRKLASDSRLASGN